MKVQFTQDGPEVTCERCLKLLPAVDRTAWDLILNEEEAPSKPEKVKKPRIKVTPAPEPTVRREEAMRETFNVLYGVEDTTQPIAPNPPTSTEYGIRIPWQAWGFVLTLLAMLTFRWLTK
jgi:hypothetical protein